jgi:hypothetical protein
MEKIPGQRKLFKRKQNMEHCIINQAVGHDQNNATKDKKDDTHIDRQRPGAFRTTHGKYLLT